MRVHHWAVIALSVCCASSVSAAPQDFDVTFDNCSEFAGIGNVSATRARALVPAHYTLAGDSTNAMIVVRVVNCESVAVDGNKGVAAYVAQIGIMLENGPDTSADINNYLLWFVTDVPQLNGKLQAAGLDSSVDQQLSYSSPADDTGPLTVSVAAAGSPSFRLAGQATAPNAQPVPFTASWWFDGSRGTARMRTVFPQIRFGESTDTLTTEASSALGTLLGASSLQFPLLDSYNTFGPVTMQVRLP